MSLTIPLDEPDGGDDQSAKEGDQQRDRPQTLQIQSDGEVSDVPKQEPLTESSTMNSISPLQKDTVDAEYERRQQSPISVNGFPVTEASTPGSRASPDKSITEKLKQKIRHFSGARTDSLPPPLDTPVTEEKFQYVLGYLREMEMNAIVDYLNSSDLNANDTVDIDTGKKAVHILCETENASLNVFKALQKCGHRFTIFTKKGFTTLHLAVRKFNNELVKELLKIHPELINIPDDEGLTPVHVSVFYRNKEAFDLMLPHSPDLTVISDKNKLSPLHLAIKTLSDLTDIQEANKETVQQDIHKTENMIETIVIKANQDQLHKALMQKFPVGLEQNEYPLHLLGRLKQLKAIRDISDKIPDPTVYGLRNGADETAFMRCLQAAWQRRTVRQASLLDSVLERAVRERQESLEKAEEEDLAGRKKKKTKSKSKKDTQEIPYEIYLESCRYLLIHMIDDVDTQCRHQLGAMTPLQMVLYRCQNLRVERDLVESLLEKGADVLIENDYDTPIEIVLSNNFRRDILSLFRDHLSPETINNRDCNNSTVLHYAVSIGDKDFITKLLENQADPSIEAASPDSTDVDFYNNPNAFRPINTVKKTPLVLSLTHATVDVYLEALRRADISEVIKNVENSQLLLFFQNHLTAAACFSAKEVIKHHLILITI